jgi:hypothetical protein
MKKMMMIMLSLLLAVPTMAQYGRRHPEPRPRYAPARQTAPSYRRVPTDVYYGVRIGAAFSTVNSDDPYLDGGSMRTGLNVGAAIGLQVAPLTPIYFETGLSYVEKGGTGHVDGAKFTYSLNYLEMPLVLKYQVFVDNMLSIQPFLGGYLAVGIDGKIKDFGNRHAFSSFGDEGFKRFDGGIRVGCGLQFNYLYAEVGYDFGLANIGHDNFDTTRTGSLFATIGVNF